ncbi:MAG: site-specific integrase [Clostridia bacterium]|nr:site-specific integrase [Clostridia bacterium]
MAKKRKNGQGTIRLRVDGRWEGRVVIGYDELGRPKTKCVTAKTKMECQEKLEELKKSIGVTDVTKCKSDMSFGEWTEFWYQNYAKPGLGTLAREDYEKMIRNQIKPKIGQSPLNQITTGMLERYYAHLKTDGRLIRREAYGNGLANSVVRRIHALCRASLERAKIEGLIRENPAVHCKLPPKKSREIKVLTTEEMQRLLIQAKEEGCYEMFLLELSTGLRRGELLGLQWDDINLETGELKVNRQIRYHNKELEIMPLKTKAAYRTIILPPQLVEVLKEFRKRVYSKWLFPSPYKSEDVPRNPNSCRQRLSIMLERANCKHVPFHALRHTFATQALRYGMPIKTLACIIGHESVETTLDVYSHITDEGMKNAAKTIDRTMGALASDYTDENEDEEQIPKPTKRTKFEANKGKTRRPGTGSIKKVAINTWQGRYAPTVNGKRVIRHIYANSPEECEQKLTELIAQMKEEYKLV